MTHIGKPNGIDNELRHSLLSGEATYGCPATITLLAPRKRRTCEVQIKTCGYGEYYRPTRGPRLQRPDSR